MTARSRLAWYRGKEIHVLGFSGTEGSAVIDFLVGRGITTITAHALHGPEEFEREFDRTHPWLPPGPRREAAARLLAYPITFRWRDRYLEGLERAEVIFVPQSWFRYPQNAPVARRAERGVPLSSMTHLFFEECPGPIIGVTGTNGKFTVAYLVHQMLQRTLGRAFFSGNDRSHVPMLYFLDDLRPTDWLVLEISNRQLVGLPYSPRIAVVTNIAPHHLDDHGSFEAYVEAKAGILRHQGPEDVAVLNADNPHTKAMAAGARNPYFFSRLGRVAPGAFIEAGSIVIVRGRLHQSLPVSLLRQPGAHAVENALAAALTAALAGASAPAIAETLDEFRGLPYRLRLAAERGGVRFFEDSLATNPTAAAAAVASMDRPFILIAGGARPQATPEQFRPMADALRRSPVRAVLLIGACAPQLAEALAGLPVPVRTVGTLDRAVAEATAAVRPGEAVLLSPGCESFDQFRDYRERGDRFIALVGQETQKV
ncbi:MAG: UDP-N-acetylmuramoyl-L-alanine--D-glutamate ligase [Armatimonadota bacterium]|nr:UDP-N-acetylmuramoyl-L-alanine--D-glutamate ligase [Armatimonadota bacterium]MDR7451750.1 UDP-N-acetylmuramoyl-L-alanine--D-glutamate ligase [Armatimonadota bacterium]MDR7467375.1 UDP-N-acetylmuramoyl-L-alanine--D-glutamate ligase [Armatimonadota bacterium]MDR7494145.1 UDP-N-acetylmuramoyl-L-alanine--D-glutamate ligase [Armatimonadota bacterium]MDR7498889.1 UDP-N-acetylmuramoyl-L-alanine--D-glutamate ligase [Armatimonadota bacterium]